MSPYQRKLLRVPNGVIFGVCAGLARRVGISVALARIITLIAFLSSGFCPIGVLYLVAALLLPVGPEYY